MTFLFLIVAHIFSAIYWTGAIEKILANDSRMISIRRDPLHDKAYTMLILVLNVVGLMGFWVLFLKEYCQNKVDVNYYCEKVKKLAEELRKDI